MTSTTEKKKVKFTPEKDLFLVRTVVQENPYQGTSSWDRVASVLAEGELVVSARTAKDRVARLLKQFRADDAQAMKRSGTDEEVTEMSTLLTELCQIVDEVKVKRPKKSDIAKEREKAKGIREAAMAGMAKKQVEDEEAVDGPNEEEGKEPAPKRKRINQHAATLDFLRERSQREATIKEAELRLREQELQLQRDRFELERQERLEMMRALISKPK